MPKGKKRKASKSAIPSFLWGQEIIYLPTVYISKELQNAADKHATKRKIKSIHLAEEEEKEKEEEWNPSWDDEDEYYEKTDFKSTKLCRSGFAVGVDMSPLTQVSPIKVSPVKQGKVTSKTSHESTEVGADNRSRQNSSSTNKNHQETDDDEPQKTKVVKKKRLQKNFKPFKKLKATTTFTENLDNSSTLTEDEKLEKKKANRVKLQNRANDGKLKQTFPKVKALNFDRVNPEDTAKELNCDDCGKTFSKIIHLTLHRKVHSQMKRDLKEKESQKQTSVSCDHCGRKFERSNQLKFHKKLCKDKSKSKASFEKKIEITEKSETASKTSKETRKSPALKETIKIQSNSLKEPRKTTRDKKCKRSPQKEKFKCRDCDKEFNRQDILDFHINNHSKTCQKCGFKIHQKDMYLHKRSCKIESLRPTLPTPVPDTSDLEVNNDNTENEDKKIQSGVISLLEIHGDEFYENVDSENYLTKLPFRCDHLNCSSRFSDKSDLIYHIQQIHLPENDLCCAMCGRDFEYITELKEHCLSMGHLMTQKQKSCHKAQAIVIAATSDVSSKQNPVYYFTTDHLKDKSLPNPYVLLKSCDKLATEISEKRKTIKREIISPEKSIKREIIPTENSVSLNRRTHSKYRGKFRTDIPRTRVYTCDACNKKFYNRKLYLIHLNQHKREEKYKCDICERKFLSDDLLQAHRKRHEDPSYAPRSRVRQDIPFQNEYLCLRCNKIFENRSYYITHLSHHKLQDKYRCETCNKGFHNETQLQMHMQRHEKDPSYVYTPPVRPDIPLQGIYHCNICGKTVYQRRFYLIHLAQHRREEKYKCKICDRKFQSGNILRSHMTLHSDPSYVPGKRSRIPVQDVYTCGQCRKQFTDRQKYILHTNYHKRENKFQIQSGTENIKVKSCNNKINEISQVPSALVPVPAPANRISCDDCRKLFTSQQHLKVHQLKFCKRIPCNIKCGKCSERFRTRLMLKRHEMRVHGGRQKKNKSFTEDNVEHRHHCPQCSQTFNTTFGLTRHVAIYHPASDFPSFMRQDQDNNEFDDGDNDADIMLPADFCKAELSPEESSSRKELETTVNPVARKRTCVAKNFRRPTNRQPGKMCICALLKKYKSEKFCHNMKCPCIQAGRRCNKKCRCKTGCLNTDLRESEQQEQFRKERENMLNEERESRLSRSRSSSFENSEENLEKQPDDSISLPVPTDAPGETSVVASKLLYSSLIPSEVVTINENPDETLSGLPFSGFVEGVEGEDETYADLGDPLGDPEPDPEAEASPLQPTLQEEGHETISENLTLPTSLSSVTLEPITSVSIIASYSLSQGHSLGQREFNQSACLRCQFCKQIFKTAPDFISHIMNHVDDGTVIGSSFKCPLGCTNDFSQLVTFLFHLERHNKGTNLQCKLCSSLFKTEWDREMHTKAYHYNPTVCGLCFAKLPDSDSLLTHWTKVHPTYQCGVCSVKFFAYEDLTFHMKSLHSPYECTRCNWRTEKILDLVAHHRHNHANVAPPQAKPEFKCVFCGEIYDNMGVLNKHLSSHTFEREKVTVAESTTTQLPAIEPLSGENLRPEFVSPTESSTTKVNDNVEPMEEFNCQVCCSHFQSKKGLMLHLRSHKDFVLCSVCNSVFKTLADLKNHLRESTCKVFECEMCFKNFQNRFTLRQHVKFTHNINSSPSTSKTTLQGYNSWNSQNSSKDSFPVIIASKSLAPSAQLTVNQNENLTRDEQEPFRLQPSKKPVEIEEIVLE